jgi:hypothetical protein
MVSTVVRVGVILLRSAVDAPGRGRVSEDRLSRPKAALGVTPELGQMATAGAWEVQSKVAMSPSSVSASGAMMPESGAILIPELGTVTTPVTMAEVKALGRATVAGGVSKVAVGRTVLPSRRVGELTAGGACGVEVIGQATTSLGSISSLMHGSVLPRAIEGRLRIVIDNKTILSIQL